jgi:FtsP/CotA-like multicopper oxidase with cupredoxin domain
LRTPALGCYSLLGTRVFLRWFLSNPANAAYIVGLFSVAQLSDSSFILVSYTSFSNRGRGRFEIMSTTTSRYSLLIALVLQATSVLSFKRTREYTLPIVNKVIAPDTVQRDATLAGGTLPGTIISGNKGDKFKINVQNQLQDSAMWKGVSVHWHGLHQKRNNYADGTSWVTQCPIAPGHSFLYEFDVPDQAGTFWYHSHFDTQYCDGLRGPFIIYDPFDPMRLLYDYDNDDTILTVGDW